MDGKVNIFGFDDYRALLSALIEDRRKQKKVFSYRWFAQKAGLTSPNFLNLVVKGKRHLSSESCESVIKIFQMTKDEGTFFRNLVGFNKAKTLSDKEHFAQQLIRIKGFQNQFPLTMDQFEYYSKWYHIPVRELLTLKNLPQTEEEMSRLMTPGISRDEVAAALQKLSALSLAQNKDGRWSVQEENVTTGHKFSNYGVVQYHKKMLGLAAEALDRFSASEREISSVTIGMSEATFRQAKSLIEEFRSQLMNLAENDKEKERVYQINFQLYPLSNKPTGEPSK